MLLAEELIKLIEDRYPDRMPLVELSPFRQGELVGIRKLINEMKAEIKNGTDK